MFSDMTPIEAGEDEDIVDLWVLNTLLSQVGQCVLIAALGGDIRTRMAALHAADDAVREAHDIVRRLRYRRYERLPPRSRPGADAQTG